MSECAELGTKLTERLVVEFAKEPTLKDGSFLLVRL